MLKNAIDGTSSCFVQFTDGEKKRAEMGIFSKKFKPFDRFSRVCDVFNN